MSGTVERAASLTSVNEKIKRVLGWQPRGTEEQIVAAGRSLIDLGVV